MCRDLPAGSNTGLLRHNRKTTTARYTNGPRNRAFDVFQGYIHYPGHKKKSATRPRFAYFYRKRGSASYIVREVRSVRQRDTETDGSDVTIVALKLAMSLHFPLPKITHFVSPFTLLR